MVQRTFTEPATAIPANKLIAGQARTLTSTVKSVAIVLTDSNGTWPVAIDNTRHIVCWGVQVLRGTDWKWFVWQGDPGSTGLMVEGENLVRNPNLAQQEPFGIRNKAGAVDLSLLLGSSDLVGATGDQLRLAIQLDAPYTFGATITVN